MAHTKIDCQDCKSKASSIFCQVTTEEVFRQLNQSKVCLSYKRGQTIFNEGNPPYGIYCINSGKIKLTKSGQEGKESIVRIATGGEMIGQRSLFAHDHYQATATAVEDTQICYIDRKHIQELMAKNPSISQEIITHLGRAMGAAEDKLAEFTHKNVRERLASFLLEMKERFGIPQSDGTTLLDMKLTREELASVVGVATETAIRFVSEFKDEGAIDQKGKNLIIIDEAKLRELGNVYDA